MMNTFGKKITGIVALIVLTLCGVTEVKADTSDFTFNSGVRYSQWVTKSRMHDYYANTTHDGFAVYNAEGKTENALHGKSKLDYVPGLVAKAIVENVQYYSQYSWAQSWAKPFFYSMADYGNYYYNRYNSTGGSLDDLNASKVFFGLYDLTKAGGAYNSDGIASTTKSNAQTALGTAQTGFVNHNTNYKISSSTSAYSAHNIVENGWYHKSTYVDEMWLDGSYMGPALFAQLRNYNGSDIISDDWTIVYRQIQALWEMCWNSSDKLLYHAFAAEGHSNYSNTWSGFDTAGGVYHSASYWGRACGWYFLALIDILEQMDAAGLSGTANYATLQSHLSELAAGLAARQDATTGCWYQILDETSSYSASSYNNGKSHSTTDNYLESSASALFTAGYLKAIRKGYLLGSTVPAGCSNNYETIAKNGYQGLVNNFFAADGSEGVHLFGSCRSAGLGSATSGKEKYRDGSKAYYLLGYDVARVAKSENVTEGKILGAFIFAATEYERLYQNNTVLFEKDLAPTYDLTAGDEITCPASGSGASITYQWYKDGVAVGGATSATIEPAASGDYYCTATSGGTTVTSSTTTVTVSAATTYTVTFDAATNGGTCATASLTQASSGASITLPAASKDGNTFNGWYTASTGGTLRGTSGASYTPTADETLYAQFTPAGGGDDIVWDFSNLSAQDFTNNRSYSFNATDGTTEMRYSSGSSDKVIAKDGSTSGYLKENGNTGSGTVYDIDGTTNIGKTRLIRLYVTGTGTLTINCNGTNNGVYKVYNSNATNTAASSSTALISSLSANTESSEITVTNGLWIETTTKGYITSIVWSPSGGGGSTYTVSYNMNGHGDAIADATGVTALPNPLPSPTATGYTFAGWYTDSGLTSAAVAGASIDANTPLYAKWTLNAPTFSPTTGTINPTDNVTISGIPSSYVYAAWGASAIDATTLTVEGNKKTYNGSGEFTATASGTGTRVLSARAYDGTLYSDVATATYTIRTANTLALSTASGSVEMGNTLDISGYVTDKNNTSTTVTYTSNNTGVATVSAAGVITPVAVGSTTITVAQEQSATYTAGEATFTVTVTSASPTTYTVTYYGNGNTGGSVPVDASSPYASGSNVTVLGNTGSLVKTGYTFNGWNTDAGGEGTAYSADATISSIAANATLYAQWNANTYTITLNANGGDANKSTTATYDSSTLTSWTAPTKSGYTLTGYWTATSGGNKIINANGTLVASTSYTNGSSQWTYDGTETLYAQWEENAGGDKYYILGAQAVASDGALTKASSHSNLTLKYIKYNGSTYSTTTDVSFSATAGINGKFESSAASANISDILTSSKWGTGSGSAFAAGIKFAKGTTYTLALGSKTITKISFLCYPAGKASSISIGGTAKTTSSQAWTLHEWTGSFTGNVSVVLSSDNDIYGVFVLETGGGATTYNVTYNGNGNTGGTAPTDATNYSSGASVTIKGNTGSLVKTGYTFDGWNNKADGSGDDFTPAGTFTITRDTTLYAKWTAAAGYTITYNVNTVADGSTAMADAIASSAGQTTLPDPLPTPSNVKTGYTFEGWYTDAAWTTPAVAGTAIDANTTLYANYTINATTISPASGTIAAGATLTVTPPTGASVTKVYRRWSGGSTYGSMSDFVSDKSTGTAASKAADAMITSNTFASTTTTGSTRKLSWVATDGKWYTVPQNTSYTVSAAYTVTYEGNGNTGGSVPVDGSSPYASGSNVTVLGNTGSLVKTGYIFNGWNTDAGGNGTAYSAGGTISSIAVNTTLYAQWAPEVTTYTITLNGNGGSGGDASVTATLDEALPSFTAPIRSGYVLTGYYDASSDGNKIINADGTLVASTSYANSDSQWTGTSNITLYAQWTAVYTVTFDATTNSGTCGTASLTQTSSGASITLPAASKDGNTFNGWYTASSGGALIGTTGASYIPAANITLYAQFSAAVSTEKFHFLSKTASSGNIQTASELQITEDNYADDVTDGDVYYFNNNSSRDYKFGMKLGGNAEYLKIVLDTPLAIGDVITFVEGYGSTNQISFTTSTPRQTSPATSENTYTVTSTDGLAGESTIYVWRASGSTTYVKEITITTSGEAATYAVTYNMGGIADDIETLEDQTTLPDPLPTPTGVTDGYTFEGWYTDDAFTTPATAGVALAANATLYANYIIDTPTISQNGGEIYAGAALALNSDVPFTQVYATWTGADAAFSKATAVDNPGSYRTYNSTAIDTYNFTCADGAVGTRYFAYMISDGTFYSVPEVTEAFTVSNIITISAQPASATYVQNATPSAITVTASVTGSGGNAGTLSYQWKECATDDGEFTNVSAGSGGNTASYTPVTTATGTTYFKCVISSDNGAASVETDVVYVTVNAAAAFTVSFDKGVGSNTAVADITQASSGASITLPGVTLKDSNYTLDGWYLEGVKVGTASDSYVPSGNVTLTAKYNCKVRLEKGTGSGNVPTAVIKSTGAAVADGDFVLEGTTLTITASPADKFVGWSVGMTGSDNPRDYVVNEYKRFVANYVVPEYNTLYHTDFTETAWSGINGVNGGGTVTAGTSDTMTDPTVTAVAGSGVSYGWTSGTLTVAPNNYNSTNYIAIPVKGVNGELTITVANGTSKTQFKYNVVAGSATDAPGTPTSSTAAKPSTVTVKALAASNYVVYIGRQTGSYNKYTEITITTPRTKLAADSAQVRIMGTSVDVPVHITTNSPGTVSIKTDPTSSIATASYNAGSGVLTVSSVAVGTTSVVMQVAASGDYPARELEIPIKVEVPTITIKTQPSNIVCYQNDAADKTFTVVATVNTGNELTYQWYTCNSDGTGASAITGATSATYTLNTSQKATVGTAYYKCKVSSKDCDDVYTAVKSVTVNALTAGGTYNTNVYVGAPGNVVTYTGLASNTISTDTGSSYYSTNTATSGQIVITASAAGTGVITLDDGTIINVTVKKHTISLMWSADSKVYTNLTAEDINTVLTIDDGSHPENMPYLIRLYEDGTPYTGRIDYYIDDTSIAYFGAEGSGTSVFTKPAEESTKPTIRYGGSQGGCKFYAYIDASWSSDAESVKTAYDLRVQNGFSNAMPKGRAVEAQQQYTMYEPGTDNKLITITYGGYKYNGHKWNNKVDSWVQDSELNSLVKIDGFNYAVRNKDRDATDEYMHALHENDDNFGSAWYASGEGGTSREYQRIKPFRLPCRASYLMFTAHESGRLTAYVYQNGIIGRGGADNQIASGPRLGYWFDEEGWVQTPVATVVSKQTIKTENARDKRSYGGYSNMDEQLVGYWTNPDDAIVVKKLRSRYCKDANNLTDNLADYELDNVAHDATTYPDENPYYWGKTDFLTENNAKVVPTPERPIPHEGGHMIVNEGFVKYTLDVEAGKTYYFFGKMTKVGYAGMNFVRAASENRQTERVDLAANDVWTSMYGEGGTALKNNATTIYDEVTVPSNYRIGKWNTICLPFAVSENQVEQVFGKNTELALFNGLYHDVANHIYYIRYLRHVDQNILPGQPYLIYPTGRAVAERTNQENGGMAETGEDVATVGTTDKVIGSTIAGATRITFNNVIINKGVTAQNYGCDLDADGSTSYVFTATDQQKSIKKYDLYITPKTGELKRYMPTNPAATMTLNAYHAFIKANSEEIKQDAITFAFSEDDVIKSWEDALIDNVSPDDPETQPTGVEKGGISERNAKATFSGKAYNMMGQEIDSTSAKGMIIVDGKKYIR